MGIRTLALVGALGAALGLGGVGSASAQPPDGIVRPTNDAAIPLRRLGPQLYAGNCLSCHGIAGKGVTAPAPGRGAGQITGLGPSLRGVGALSADFYLRTGYMPLGRPEEQPERSRPSFDDREIRALTGYVASLDGGPVIPHPRPSEGKLPEGLELFTEHCAGCHTVAAQGGFVTGARVPPLADANARQIAQAVRIGPYLMPRFSERQISNSELDSIIRYVGLTKNPVDQGGWGIGNLGPFPEGIVTWFIAIVALIATCVVIGKRVKA